MLIQVGISCKWINDSKHFLLEHFYTIHNSPSHIYYSALPFSPPSWLHKCYGAELSLKAKIVKGLPADWGACSRTVLLDDCALALLCWNDITAVGAEGGDTIILDAITGQHRAVISGHGGCVTSVTFSSDGRSLVSGSYDAIIKLWDVQTGGVIKTFYGHTDWVESVSISVDCSRIVSGSSDNTIHLWDIQTGKCCCTIEQEDIVYHVSFSPTNPQNIISAAGDSVWQWDVNGHRIPPTYNGSQIAFSPDHTQFALCNQEVIKIQNSDSGGIVAKFHVVNDYVKHCCFSPDGKLVAATADNTTFVWDISSPNPHLIHQ